MIHYISYMVMTTYSILKFGTQKLVRHRFLSCKDYASYELV